MAFDRMRFCKEQAMSNVVYVSKAHIERREGPLRIAHLPGESKPVIFSVHGAIAEHYKIAPRETQGVALLHHRLRHFCNRRLNDGHLRRRAGGAPN
jgi:hypothetical protein